MSAANGTAQLPFDYISTIHSIEHGDELALLVCFRTAKKIYELDVHRLRSGTGEAQLVDID